MKLSPPKTSIRTQGAALVEYALLIALIAVVCVTALQTIGTKTQLKLEEVATKLQADQRP